MSKENKSELRNGIACKKMGCVNKIHIHNYSKKTIRREVYDKK